MMKRATSTMAAVLAGLALAVSPVSPATPTAHAADGFAGDFYSPPASLPVTNGALVRTEPMKLTASFSLDGNATTLPGTATRILYRSTDEAGQPVAVSGAYIEPAKAWPGSGPRPLVSFSVGTQGTGDACAPSKTLEKVLNIENGKFMIGYEIPAIYRFLNKGVAVVVTDYVGLGTTDRVHTYMNRVDQAHAVLDAARAALNLTGTSLQRTSPIGFYGYSQGGGASGAAVEMAPSYAPELNLKGAYVGGPPADLYEVMKQADGTMLTGVIPWTINAMLAYRPGLVAPLAALMNDEGSKVLENSKNQCIVDAILTSAFKKTSSWTESGNLASVDAPKFPAILKAVDDQRIGRLTPTVPVQVLTGTKDDIVAHGQAKQLAVDWCSRGVNVTYRPVIQLLGSGGTMLNHMAPLLSEQKQSANWLVDRLEGESVTSNCRWIKLMP